MLVDGTAVPCGVVARGIVWMAQRWGGVQKNDLAPFLTRIDVIPDQTDDPVLNAAAERVHDALCALLAEIAVVIYSRR